jgi:hypothetical protein
MTLRLGIDGKCRHDGYHCSKLILETHYLVTRGIPHPTDESVIIPEFIRWSNSFDPPFPCLCACEECCSWRALQEEFDGPIVLPTK